VRGACIDIGSNTTRLLVAELDEHGLRELTTQRVFNRLRGFDGPIPPEKVSEVAACVASQVRMARESGASSVWAVATAAIRGAVNGEELCAAVREASGIQVDVLSGEDEARLAFAGAVGTLPDAPAGSVAVVDVGGGSSEVVVGTAAGGVTWARSLRVGSGGLADRYLLGDPPTGEELAAVRSRVSADFEDLAAPPVSAAYAVGGGATSLRRLIGPVLDRDTLGGAISVLCAAPAADVAAKFDLHVERVKVLPAGMLLLDAASTALGVPLRIAGGGLREGVLLERLRAQSQETGTRSSLPGMADHRRTRIRCSSAAGRRRNQVPPPQERNI
jgi:exopolyphosphatase/guanosine-5'-triphosphate,3'-diphosphate pyrophosphatase